MSNTNYVELTGTVKWAKVYKPDDFQGRLRWQVDFYMDDESWAQFKTLGIKKKVYEDADGKFWRPERLVTKMMKGQLIYFTPPMLFDADGKVLAAYEGPDRKWIRSYEDPATKVVKVGERPLIGNGSKVKVRLSTYNTAMGTGNRLESITVLDLVTYEATGGETGGGRPQLSEEERNEEAYVAPIAKESVTIKKTAGTAW